MTNSDTVIGRRVLRIEDPNTPPYRRSKSLVGVIVEEDDKRVRVKWDGAGRSWLARSAEQQRWTFG